MPLRPSSRSFPGHAWCARTITRVMRALTLLAAATVLLSGCASSIPFRTSVVETVRHACEERIAATDPACAHATPEVSRETPYELHFVEFDDQGWLHAASEERGEAQSQLDRVMAAINEKLSRGSDLNIIVFVHGWKHGAAADDVYVRQFRRLLAGTSDAEAVTAKREVIGIYVGWRGRPWTLPGPLLNLSFWSRKAAALRVSEGSVRELFSRLSGLQRYWNAPEHKKNCHAPPASTPGANCNIRMLYIGHSFGGWIIYSAISQSLIEALSADRDIAQSAGSLAEREGIRSPDLVVLLNPAFEGSRYEPLHRVALRYRRESYRAPLLVSVTSSADLATGMAFPVGRWFNTLFQHPISSPEQKEAMKNTIGHIPRYITHTLSRKENTCARWGSTSLPDGTEMHGAELRARLRQNYAAERNRSAEFFAAHREPDGAVRLPATWTREFCGGAFLEPAAGAELNEPHSAVWNIRTDKDVMANHDDIMQSVLRAFIRQVYDDVVTGR